ncbi:hypothetical protein [Nonomuraea sediminis]|uniref:hypothetical protein n=1 Tax=Nonomuraea sediminis TaxID=2835864 RepID=UPI001BDDA270|nr:hypothetical protein [Nonomuraea sediminis]
MIFISAGLVLAAVVLLIAGFVLGAPYLIMWSIVVSVLSALFLVIGAFLRRHELFPSGERAATPPAPPAGLVPPAVQQGPVGASRAQSATIPAPTPRRPTTRGISPDAIVLVIPGRKRYHVPGCRQLAGRDHEELTYEEAREEGFTPCTTCLPDAALGGRQLPPAADPEPAVTPQSGPAVPVDPEGAVASPETVSPQESPSEVTQNLRPPVIAGEQAPQASPSGGWFDAKPAAKTGDPAKPGTAKPGTAPAASQQPAGTSKPGSASGPTPAASERQPGSSDRKPGATERQPGSSDRKPGASETKPGSSGQKPGTAETKPGASESKPGASESKPGASRQDPADESAATGPRLAPYVTKASQESASSPKPAQRPAPSQESGPQRPARPQESDPRRPGPPAQGTSPQRPAASAQGPAAPSQSAQRPPSERPASSAESVAKPKGPLPTGGTSAQRPPTPGSQGTTDKPSAGAGRTPEKPSAGRTEKPATGGKPATPAETKKPEAKKPEAAEEPEPDGEETRPDVRAPGKKTGTVKVIVGTRRYHSTACPLIRGAGDTGVETMTLAQAEAAGLTSCSVCQHDRETVA